MHIGKLKSLLEAIELMEYKREITASKMKSTILSGLQKDNFFNDQLTGKDDDAKVDAVLSKLEEMDPTNNKQFVPWLAKNYGLFRIEDGGRANDTLSKFVKLKTQISRQGKSVDIGQYDWNSLEAMINEVAKVDVGNSSTNLNYEHMDDIDVLYSGAYGKLMVPKTEAASCEIGSGTKWCTAARNGNRFDDYNSKGKLYVWIDKSGDKYQFHFEKREYMDSVDRGIPQDKMKYFVNEHPVLSKFFSKMAPKYPVFAVMYLNNPDKDIQMAAVTKDGYVIEYIKNPDKDVQMAAVTENGYAIKYIENPHKDVQLAAVKLNGRAIAYIENPDNDVQFAAVNQNGTAIEYIENPDNDVQLAAVTQNGTAIEYIKNPDKDVQMAAVTKSGSAIYYIKNPAKDVQMAAVTKYSPAIQYIVNPDKDVQMAAVKQDGYVIRFIKNPDKDVQMTAVNQNGRVIGYIKNPDKDVQIASIKNNGYGVITEDKFSPEVIQWAKENGYI